MTEYVAGFLFEYQNRVALILKAKPAWQKGRLNGIGGKIEPGETPLQAMAREFEEETGFVTAEEDWTPFVVLRGEGYCVHFFRCVLAHAPNLRGSGDEPCGWYAVSDLPRNVIPNLRWLVPLALEEDVRFPVEIYDHSVPAANGAAMREASDAP
jgi:8-oxo-dGTP diphosphatase